MGYSIPSRQQLHDEFIRAKVAADPEADVSRGSSPWVYARAISALAWSVVAKLLGFDKQRLPDTATGTNLQRWGDVYAFPKLGAQPSQGTNALAVTGVPGAAVTVNSELTHADGTAYKVTSIGAVIGVGGSIDVDILALSTGLSTNKVAGELLTFTAAPTDVDDQATLVADLTHGLDNEDDEPYRSRLLPHIADPPEGGAIHDYIEWARENFGVSFAYVWRFRRGLGTIDLAVLGDGDGAARVLTILSDVDESIEEKRPGNARDFLVLVTTPQTQNIAVRMEIDETKYKWDWNDGGLFTYLITAFDAVAHTITVPGAPADLSVGKRLTVRGQEMRVTARVGVVLSLGSWFTFAPTGVDFVCASGDLVVPAQAAVRALFARLGPARDKRYAANDWASDLLTDDIIAAVKGVVGDGKKVIVDTPSADVVPVDALNGATAVPFLVPGIIQITRKV